MLCRPTTYRDSDSTAHQVRQSALSVEVGILCWSSSGIRTAALYAQDSDQGIIAIIHITIIMFINSLLLFLQSRWRVSLGVGRSRPPRQRIINCAIVAKENFVQGNPGKGSRPAHPPGALCSARADGGAVLVTGKEWRGLGGVRLVIKNVRTRRASRKPGLRELHAACARRRC
jgi:hypothetical protein